MMTEELRSCPFCGGEDAFVERADFIDCYVICNDCSARGPVSCDENEADAEASKNGLCEPGELPARRLWNTRPSTPPAVSDDLVDEIARAIQDAYAPGHPLNHVSIYQARAIIPIIHRREQMAAEAMRERCARAMARYDTPEGRMVRDFIRSIPTEVGAPTPTP